MLHKAYIVPEVNWLNTKHETGLEEEKLALMLIKGLWLHWKVWVNKMSLAFDITGPTRRLNRQSTTIDLFGNSSSSFGPLRRHHSSLDLLQLTRESKNDRAPPSQRSLDTMGVDRRRHPQQTIEVSPDSNSRPGSKTSVEDKSETKSPRKFPILGPTRQQAEFYFKQKSKK